MLALIVTTASACDGYMVVGDQGGDKRKASDRRDWSTGEGGEEQTSTEGGSGGADQSGEERDLEIPAPEGPGLRRLTAFEYNNALADLLGDEARPARALAAPTGSTYGNAPTMQIPNNKLVEAAETLALQATKTAFADQTKARKLVGCQPDGAGDEECMREFARSFARRAFARVPTTKEVDNLVQLGLEHAQKTDFWGGSEVLVRAVLQHPKFLYRWEVGESVEGKEKLYRLDNYEIASRMAYLIWGAPPDEPLLEAAEQGRLAEPEVRRRQAKRMIEGSEENRRKTKRRLQRFHAHWLGYQNSQLSDLGEAARRESDKLIERVVFEKRTRWMELFTWPETFVGEQLAKHYGLPTPPGDGPGWVPYSERNRAGILSHASFLNAGTTVGETSPTLRGKHVYQRLFCEKIPPPPPTVNVDETSLGKCGSDGTCIRPKAAKGMSCETDDDCPEKLACKSEHSAFYTREDSGCASCHAKMDPIGLGLENYSATGKWRKKQPPKDLPEDANYEQPDCTIEGKGKAPGLGEFRGPGQLGKLVADSEQVQRCAVRQFYQFAWGKPDVPTESHGGVKGMFQAYQRADGRLLGMMVEVVADESFALRRGDGSGGGEGSSSGDDSQQKTELKAGVDIAIPRADGWPTIDGRCQEYGAADRLEFSTAIEGYDNQVDCRLTWSGEASSPTLHGCCRVRDSDLEASVAEDDTSGIWNDDGVAWLMAEPTREKNIATIKAEINVDGVIHDANFANGEHDTGFDAGIDRKVVRTDVGYDVEWSSGLGVEVSDDPTAYCNFRINDKDGGNSETGYGTTFGNPLLTPENWGLCQFTGQ
ncbi:MAG: DUF1592 domain-containing protein [Bradymonadaceae bacterium]